MNSWEQQLRNILELELESDNNNEELLTEKEINNLKPTHWEIQQKGADLNTNK